MPRSWSYVVPAADTRAACRVFASMLDRLNRSRFVGTAIALFSDGRTFIRGASLAAIY